MKRLHITLITLLLVLTISAKEYHVAKTGNDKNKGTIESSLLTIQAATNLGQAGNVYQSGEGLIESASKDELLEKKSWFAEVGEKTSTILWQLDSQGLPQMNSYVLQTPNKSIIVIDGGYKQNAPYLKGFLAALGNHVDMWIISHPHSDHISALTEILKQPDGLTIDQIWGSFPTVEWAKKYEEGVEKDIVEFQYAMNQENKKFLQVKLGDIFEIDNIAIEVLGIINPEFTTYNAINNSCMVFKMNLPNTSLLFLGDLGHAGGEKLLAGAFSSKLPSDYVQMAHHGQQGVSEEFYKFVDPDYCLWPTSDWLWDNNKGEGKNSGPWKTLEVRAWMDKLDVQKHYVMKDGLHKIILR